MAGHLYGADQPNVVVIISDDQAWTDYGFMGHPVIQTPHLDRLAEHSLVMDRGYVAAPLCRPSLASMLTGRYPFQHGITGNDVNGPTDRAALDVPLRESFHKFPTFVKTLVAHGYLAPIWKMVGRFMERRWVYRRNDPWRSKRRGRHGDAG